MVEVRCNQKSGGRARRENLSMPQRKGRTFLEGRDTCYMPCRQPSKMTIIHRVALVVDNDSFADYDAAQFADGHDKEERR